MILPSFISILIVLLHKTIPKPSLSRIKFEQLYIVKFLLLVPNFVSMVKCPNKDAPPSGAP